MEKYIYIAREREREGREKGREQERDRGFGWQMARCNVQSKIVGRDKDKKWREKH